MNGTFGTLRSQDVLDTLARMIRSAVQPNAPAGVIKRILSRLFPPPERIGVEEIKVENSSTQSKPFCGLSWPVVVCILRSLECESTRFWTTAAESTDEPSAASIPAVRSTLDSAAVSHSSAVVVLLATGRC